MLRALFTLLVVLSVSSVTAQEFSFPKAAVKAEIDKTPSRWEPIKTEEPNKHAKWTLVENRISKLNDVQKKIYPKPIYEKCTPVLKERTEILHFFYKDNSKLDIQYLDAAHGLFAGRIAATVTLDDGRILIIGFRGFGIYNGQFIDYFEPPEGYEFQEVYAANKAKDGKVWIATQNGAYYWHNGELFLLKDIGKGGCWEVKPLSDNTILIGEIRKGFYLVSDDKITQFRHEARMFDVRGGHLDENRKLWIASHNGFIQKNGDEWLSWDYFVQSSPVTAVQEYQGNIYIGTYGNGLFKWEGGQLYRLDLYYSGYNFPIYDFAVTNAGIWFSIYGRGVGLLCDNNDFFLFDKSVGLSDRNSHKLELDEFNNIWVSDFEGGISVFREENFRPSYFQTDGRDIEEVVKMGNTTYYFSHTDYVRRKVDGKFSQLRYPESFENQNHWQGDFVSEDEIWLMSYGSGVVHYKNNTITRYLDSRDKLFGINLTPNLDRFGRVWFYDYYSNLRYLQGDSIYLLKDQPKLRNFKVIDVQKDQSRNLVIATNQGLLFPERDKIKAFSMKDGLLSNNTLKVCANKFDDGFWIISDKGIQLIRDKKVQVSILNATFKNIPINSLEQIDKNKFLAGTKNGVFRLKLRGEKVDIQLLDMRYGQYLLAGDNSIITIEDTARLISNGQIYDYLDKWNGDAHAVPIVRILNSNSNKRKIKLTQDQQRLVQLEIINWGKEETVYYRLQADNKWNRTKGGEVLLSNLPYGDYTLEIKAINENGESKILKVPVEVVPYWYQEAWFVALCIFVFIVGIGFFLRYRLRIQKKRNAQLEGVVQERTEEIKVQLHLSELLLKEVHHRVKNNMQMVSGILELQLSKSSDETSKMILKTASDRIKTVYMSHRHLYLKENYETLNMKEYLSVIAESVNHSGSINISIEIPENYELPIEKAQALGMIFNELLSNALKHAWPSNSGEKNINVVLTKSPTISRLLFEDNGIGISQDQIQSKGVGMLILSGFAERQLDGKIQFDSDNGTKINIEYPDL